MITNDHPDGISSVPEPDVSQKQLSSGSDLSSAPEDRSSETLLPEATQYLLHELRARQSVLERENAELQHVQAELESARARERELESALQLAQARLTELWDVVAVADADVKTIADHILAALTVMTDSPYGFYGFINADESVMTIHAWSGEAMKGCSIVDKPTDFPIAAAGVWGEAVRRRAPLILNDYAAEHPAKKGLPVGHVPLTRLLVVPSFVHGRIVAVAAVANRPIPYTQDDVKQITAFLGSVQAIVGNKRAEEALRASEEKYRIVADFTYDWEYWRDPEGRYLYVSPSCEHITGYRAEEFLADPALFDRIIHPDDLPLLMSHREQRLLQHDDQHPLDFRIITREGQERWVAHRCQQVYGRNGEYLGRRGSNRDITRRKKIEEALLESEELFNKAFHGNSVAMGISTLNEGRYIDVNAEFARMFECPRADIIGHTAFELGIWVHPGQRATLVERIRTQGGGRNLELEFRTASGKVLIVDWSAATIMLRNELCLVASAQDITARKQAEAALQASESRFRSLIDSLDDVIFTLDREQRHTGVFGRWVERAGLTPEFFLGRSVRDIFGAEAAAVHEAANARALAGESAIYEWSAPGADGLRHYQTVVSPIRDAAGQVIGIAGVGRDITDRKRAEEALRESEERYRTLYRQSPIAIELYNADGLLVNVNPAGLDLFGVCAEQELPGFDLFADPNLPDEYKTMLRRGEIGRYQVFFDFEQVKKLGLYRTSRAGNIWLDVIITPLGGESCSGYLVQAQDITERKRAEEALRESEERYRELFENISSGVAVYKVVDDGKDFIFVDFNRAGERIDHDRRERLLGQSLFKMRPGVEKFGLVEVFRDVWQTGEPAYHPIALYEDAHLTGWYENHVYKLPSGEIVAVFDEVTERKQIEEALRENEGRLRLALTATNDVVWDRDIVRDSLRWNEAATEVLGWSDMTVELQASAWWAAHVHPADWERVSARFSATLADPARSHWQDEYRIRKADGNYALVLDRGNIRRDAQGRAVRMIGAMLDITERKRMEAALHENEERLRLALKATNDVVWDWDIVHDLQRWNEAGTEVFGWTDIVAAPQTAAWWVERVHPEERQRVAAQFDAVVADPTRTRWQDEYRFRKADGSYALVLDRGYVKRDAQGQAVRMIGAMLDITERRQMEAALQENEERLRLALKATNDVVWDWDIVHDSQRWNEAGIAVFGWADIVAEPQTAAWWVERVHPEERQRVADQFDAVVADPTRTRWQDEYRFRKADGSYALVLDRGYVKRDAQGQAVRMIGAMLDITERKEMEERLRRLNERFALAQRAAGVGVWDWNIETGQIEWSPMMFELFGLDPHQSEASFAAWESALHPDDLDVARARITQGLETHALLDSDYRVIWPDGQVRWINALGKGEYDTQDRAIRMAGICIDITERKQAEAQIKQALAERDSLLRELFHRINNNMQVVLSMLQLQAGTLHDPEARAAFTATQNRIRTMALVHQMLYSAQDLSSVNLHQYITALAEWLFNSHPLVSEHIQLELDVPEIVVLFDIAIPCGFVLNELISNALSHAFPDSRPGKLAIQLCRVGAEELLLRVADNGVGTPPGFDFRAAETLGLQIVFFTAEYQLQGRVEFTVEDGVTCRVWFKDTIYTRRV